MKRLKLITFLLILPGIFLIVYRKSDNKGFRKFWVSLRIASVIAVSLASLGFEVAETPERSSSNSNVQIVKERVVSTQELYQLEKIDGQILLVKSDGTPFFSLPGANGFTNPPPASNNRPKRPGTGNHPNFHRTPPKLVNQGFGAGGNPGGEGENPEFDENGLVPKKKKSQNPKTYDYSLNDKPKQKKKKKAEQCELDENFKKIEIVDRIQESPGLLREAKKTNKNQAAQRDINHMIEQLSLGNKNPGIGIRKIKGLTKVMEVRAKDGGRVYFRNNDRKIEILAISDKGNQNKVIALLQKMNY